MQNVLLPPLHFDGQSGIVFRYPAEGSALITPLLSSQIPGYEPVSSTSNCAQGKRPILKFLVGRESDVEQ